MGSLLRGKSNKGDTGNETGKGMMLTNLDELLNNFEKCQQMIIKAQSKNGVLVAELEKYKKSLSTVNTKLAMEHEANTQLQNMVQNLQEALLKQCEVEEECQQKTEELQSAKATIVMLTQEHELEKNSFAQKLSEMEAEHQHELLEVNTKYKLQEENWLRDFDRQLKEKTVMIDQLEKQLTEVENVKHADITKIRMEYDEKIHKLQNLTSGMTVIPSAFSMSSSHDIYRQKLQHFQKERDEEIARLKRELNSLQMKRTSCNCDKSQPQRQTSRYHKRWKENDDDFIE